MEEKNISKGIIAALSIIIIVLLLIIILIFSGKINLKTDELTGEKPVVEEREGLDYYKDIIIKEGYTEISLTDEEKETINKKLYDEFQPGNGNDPLFSSANKDGDIVSDDCMKLAFARWYISFNNRANYKFEREPAEVYDGDTKIDGYTKVKYATLEKITKEIFNVQDITCDSNKTVVADENGYITFDFGAGGFVPMAIKTLAKYQKDDTYYLLIHVYEPTLVEETAIDDMNSFLTNVTDDADATSNSRYIKLKYGVKDNKKYLINFEYLK